MHQLKSSLKSPGIRALNLADFVCTRSSTLTRWTRDSTDIPLAVHGHSGGTEGTWASFNPPPKAQGPQPNPTLEDPTSQFVGEGSLPDGRRSSTHHLRHGILSLGRGLQARPAVGLPGGWPSGWGTTAVLSHLFFALLLTSWLSFSLRLRNSRKLRAVCSLWVLSRGSRRRTVWAEIPFVP